MTPFPVSFSGTVLQRQEIIPFSRISLGLTTAFVLGDVAIVDTILLKGVVCVISFVVLISVVTMVTGALVVLGDSSSETK